MMDKSAAIKEITLYFTYQLQELKERGIFLSNMNKDFASERLICILKGD